MNDFSEKGADIRFFPAWLIATFDEICKKRED